MSVYLRHARVVRRLISWVTVFVLSVPALPLLAQSTVFATLRGRVLDADGATVPDATVTLRRVGTNEQQQVTTTVDGFSFNRASPAVYELSAEKAGFDRVSIELVLTVNDAITRDLVLPVAGATETVQVSATISGVQTRAAGVSLGLDERSISQLPLNGRDWSKLVQLAPGGGITPTSPISGVRERFNSYTVDGIGYNDERGSGQPNGGGAGGVGGPNLISAEAVQEFRVVTSNADATFGRGSGAQVNVITKSGTNELHGSGYGFFRHNKFDARDFFNTGPYFDDDGRAVTPPFQQQLFGTTVGGPLRRDRHFVFASYEGFNQNREATTSFVFPSADLIQLVPGDLGRLYREFYLARGLVSPGTGPGEFRTLSAADRSAAVAAGFDARLFDGNAANGEAGTLLQSSTVPDDIRQNGLLLRTDHVLTPRWRASARVGYTKSKRTTIQSVNASPLDVFDEPRQWFSGTAEVVGVLSAAQLLEIRGGWQRTRFQQLPQDGIGDAFRALGISDQWGIGVSATGTGLNALGFLGTPAFFDNQSIPQLSALHTWQRGRLTLRSGLDLAAFSFDINNGGGRPAYTFNGLVGPNGLLGASPNQAQAVAATAGTSVYGLTGGPTTPAREFSSLRQEYFAQADLRISPVLTANLGVRYTYTGVYRETSNGVANLYAVDPSGTLVRDVHPFTYGRTSNRLEPIGDEMYQPDRNNFQPRVGAAWDISGKGTMTARASYGAYDDRFFQLVFSAQGGLVSNPPFTLNSNAPNVPFHLGGTLPVVTSTAGVFFVDPNLRSPRVHRVSAGLEREVLRSLIVSADYVGAYGRQLFGVLDVNGGSAVAVSGNLRPDSRYSTMRQIGNTSRSDYHALQMVARQRYRSGLSFTMAYTFAKAEDNSSAETFAIAPGLVNLGASPAAGFQGGGTANWAPRPIDADWGTTTGTARHTFVFSHVFELPFGRDRRWATTLPRFANAILGGWNVSGILRARSGEAVDLRLGSDANDDGDAGDRPALLVGSLDDLYASGTGNRTQFYVSRDAALGILGASASPSDPFSWVARNAMRGPAIWFYDLSLAKQLALSSRIRLSVEANAFNLFNRANFANPIATLSDVRFGRSIATAPGTNPRQIQLGVKLQF